MISGTDISTLYREFTDALTDVLAENATGPARRGRVRQGPALPSRSTPITMSMNIFLRSKLHSKNGKPCRMWVNRTRPAQSGQHNGG